MPRTININHMTMYLDGDTWGRVQCSHPESCHAKYKEKFDNVRTYRRIPDRDEQVIAYLVPGIPLDDPMVSGWERVL